MHTHTAFGIVVVIVVTIIIQTYVNWTRKTPSHLISSTLYVCFIFQLSTYGCLLRDSIHATFHTIHFSHSSLAHYCFVSGILNRKLRIISLALFAFVIKIIWVNRLNSYFASKRVPFGIPIRICVRFCYVSRQAIQNLRRKKKKSMEERNGRRKKK